MLEEEPYDESVDWWSFGMLIYRLLTGEVCILSEEKIQCLLALLQGPRERASKE